MIYIGSILLACNLINLPNVTQLYENSSYSAIVKLDSPFEVTYLNTTESYELFNIPNATTSSPCPMPTPTVVNTVLPNQQESNNKSSFEYTPTVVIGSSIGGLALLGVVMAYLKSRELDDVTPPDDENPLKESSKVTMPESTERVYVKELV
jgi:hypothetical protein